MSKDSPKGSAQPAAAAAENAKKLSNRHVTMITLGGIIGASLFVGSGNVIRSVGPAALISYGIGGLLVILVMRMLGEMAVASPAVGSFMEYARRGLGEWAGYLIGWLYWYFWVGVIAFEAVVGGATLHGWFPMIPDWVFSIAVMLIFTIANLVSVRSFGEIEFWLASVKVATIVVFLTLGLLFAFGLWPGASFSFGNIVNAEGGFAPYGWWAVISGVALVIFSYFGTEIAVMAAAESEDPKKGVTRATNAVVWRIMLFFIGGVTLILAIVPWNQLPDPNEISPFAYVFGQIFAPFFGPGAANAAEVIMSAVLLTAVFSVLNSGIYSASRMFAAISDEGLAPKFIGKRAGNGVPVMAVLASTIGGYAAVLINFLLPDSGIFTFIMNSAGLVALLVYAFIALTQIRMRQQMTREEVDRLELKMWLHPWLAILTIIGVIGVVVIMIILPDTRIQVWSTLISVAVLVVFWPVARRNLQKIGKLGQKPETRLLRTVQRNQPAASVGQAATDGEVSTETRAIRTANREQRKQRHKR
ncbi:amino acid permease [uncultured Gulosibacter sp.]|uniref:amino acid permease n=1 Tax=uncultured Gulosibacter sp. TaxID=1339167 RepID=UPI00288A36D6|nr:amino acid permease [uncultured Gulosibacter sp.]